MSIDAVLDGWHAERVTHGMSGATTYRLHKQGEPDRYLKQHEPTWDRGLDAEAARLGWLAATPLAGYVPEVIAFEPGDRLLTSAVPGDDATRLTGRGVAVAHAMGAALRQVHDALDPASCPFDNTLDRRLEALARRVAEHLVDADEFEHANAGRTPEDVLVQLHAERPTHEDLVVTHGDWCFPNVLFGQGGGGDDIDVDGRLQWTGMVDLAGLGVACRWYDLGIGVRSAWHNLGATREAADAFLAGYGVAADDDRIRYYILVDELQ